MIRRIAPLYWVTLLIWIAYAAIVAFAPIQKPIPFHLTTQTIEVLKLTFVLPYLVIWLMGVFAFDRTRRYAQAIEGNKDEVGFRYIAWGIGGLILGLIVTAIVSSFKAYYPRQDIMQEVLTIIANYAFIWIYLAAFVALMYGARQLVLQTRRTTPVAKASIYSLPIFALTYIWLDLIFSNPLRASAENTQFVPTYYLSDSLIVMTIVLPSLATWVVALLCTIFLLNYFARVKGVIYRQALSSFIAGMICVVATSIFLEILTSLGPARLIGLGYGLLLGAIYLLFLVLLVGFGFLARGARKLIKIETV